MKMKIFIRIEMFGETCINYKNFFITVLLTLLYVHLLLFIIDAMHFLKETPQHILYLQYIITFYFYTKSFFLNHNKIYQKIHCNIIFEEQKNYP